MADTIKVQIGDMLAEEKEAVRQLLIESYLEYRAEYRDVWPIYLADIASSVDNPNVDRILVAKCNEEIVGTLQLFESSEKAYGRPELRIAAPIVRLLAVHPKARGQGIAQELLKESIRYAQSKGAPHLYLHSSEIMKKAIRLYERLGFKRDQAKDFLSHDILAKCYRFDIEKDVTAHGQA